MILVVAIVHPGDRLSGCPEGSTARGNSMPANTHMSASTFFRHSWNSFQSYMMALHLVSSVRSLAICSIFSLPSSMP